VKTIRGEKKVHAPKGRGTGGCISSVQKKGGHFVKTTMKTSGKEKRKKKKLPECYDTGGNISPTKRGGGGE